MGKTKDIINSSENEVVFKFKDDACGEDGKFEPGANQVALTIRGMGTASLMLSQYFFNLIGRYIPHHFISADTEEGTMTCSKLQMIPIEFIWRSQAWGSFCKRYGAEKGTSLRNRHGYGLVEATMKSDELGDPPICESAACRMRLLTNNQFRECEQLTHAAATFIDLLLASHGYTLIDIKFEFGIARNAESKEQIYLADEVSGGILRAVDSEGNIVDPITLAKTICNC